MRKIKFKRMKVATA